MATSTPTLLKLVVDAASLITAAKSSVDGRTVAEHIARQCLFTIVPAVYNEVIIAGSAHPDVVRVRDMVTDGRIIVEAPPRSGASVLDGYKLGSGEKESIILALAQPSVDYLVIDDRLAFIVSDRMTVPKILLVDLLAELVWRGRLERELVERMLQAIEPRYAQGFIPHTLKMLEGGNRRCLT